MKWQDRPEVVKGNFAEAIVDEYLVRSKDVIPYRPIAEGAHPFDRLCASRDKKTIFVVEVKAKRKRMHYPDTGFDERHYHDYLGIAMKYSMDVYVYFVDDVVGAIYGGELISNLCKPRQISYRGRALHYPIHDRGIVYFPLVAMETVAELTSEQRMALSSMTRGQAATQHALF